MVRSASRVKSCIINLDRSKFELEQVTNAGAERDIGNDFADLYEQSDLHKCGKIPTLTVSNNSPARFLLLSNLIELLRSVREHSHLHECARVRVLFPARLIASAG